jgi:hypothetical protein
MPYFAALLWGETLESAHLVAVTREKEIVEFVSRDYRQAPRGIWETEPFEPEEWEIEDALRMVSDAFPDDESD